MEIINRKSLSHARNPPELYLKEDRIYFNLAAVKAFNLEAGKYLHFINDDNQWHFYMDEDQDGFNLVNVDKNHPGLAIGSRPLVRLICKTMGIEKGAHIDLRKTEIQAEGKFWIKLEP